MKLLTASRLKTARECAAKERLMYAERWRPVREGEALRFGTLMHSGLEVWWRTRGDLEAACLALREAASPDIDPFDFQKAQAILVAYHQCWFDDLKLYDVIAVEAEFRAPLINPETMHPSRTWVLAGKIDAILRRRSDGRVVVREFKTTSLDIEQDSEPYWLQLSMDSQISLYILGAESLGHQAEECLYDVVHKPGQRPLKATPIESRKYKKDGTLYAAQREIDETPVEYGARIAAELAENPDKHFRRREIPRLESQIEDALFDCWQATQTMTSSHRAKRAVRNPASCFAFSSQCPFWEVCSIGADPSQMSSLRQLSSPHPELSEGEESNEPQEHTAA